MHSLSSVGSGTNGARWELGFVPHSAAQLLCHTQKDHVGCSLGRLTLTEYGYQDRKDFLAGLADLGSRGPPW